MARQLRIQYPGALYHVTCRGNDKRAIFHTDLDRKRFLTILAESIHTYHVRLHAYVLMENHVHLFLETPLGNLSGFMRQFTITYTSYFNRTHQRVGHLLQGRYKALLVEKDPYFVSVSRYIHLNPVRTEAFKNRTAGEKWDYLENYVWSSLKGYLLKEKQEPWITYAAVLGMYGEEAKKAQAHYRRDIHRELTDESETQSPIRNATGGFIVGESGFIEWVKATFLNTRKDRREIPALKDLKRRSKAEILAVIKEVTGEKGKGFLKKGSISRIFAMEYLYRAGGMTGEEIGGILGVDYSTVSQTRRRLREQMKKDSRLKKLYDDVDAKLSI